ncbi:serine protease [Pluteus cervinus]|uniref:Serine protease n=1 Tax=Pluteus cervinus TaxID=181527 RepID=A0ACD3ATY8_9AGAR|nr:serine protease [Pluteus cervinus]
MIGFFSTFLATSLLNTFGLGGQAPLFKHTGETTGRHIVKLKGTTGATDFVRSIGVEVINEWRNFNGFVGNFDDTMLSRLRASPFVESVYEDGVAYAMGTVSQTNAAWGLGRLSSTAKLAVQDDRSYSFTYTYDSSAGTGVDIYLIPLSGVYTDHSDLTPRAKWGKTFGGYADADGNGHGTHCAGIAAGTRYGVAKNTSIIAVKVLSDGGSGAYSDVISGLDWVISAAATSHKPSIVSMSLGGPAFTPVDQAVAALTAAGIHVAVAAGNDGDDASDTSPAREKSAVTVGASTIGDIPAYFSNFGPAVDIWAPGYNILSSWIGYPFATNVISGTSMATPQVAGLIAYLIGLHGNVPTANMTTLLQSLAGHIGSARE